MLFYSLYIRRILTPNMDMIDEPPQSFMCPSQMVSGTKAEHIQIYIYQNKLLKWWMINVRNSYTLSCFQSFFQNRIYVKSELNTVSRRSSSFANFATN